MKNNTTVRGTQMPKRKAFSPCELMQWPCKINLVPEYAPYFDGADILISADCAAYASDDFRRLMRDRITLIGCALADAGRLHEKLTAILRENDVKSITVARLEVGCCEGIENAVKGALEASGKKIPLNILTVSTSGRIT